MPALDAVVRLGELRGVGHPDVDHTSGHHEGLGDVEQFFGGPQVGARRAALPDGAVAQMLDGSREVGSEVGYGAPHADRPQPVAPGCSPLTRHDPILASIASARVVDHHDLLLAARSNRCRVRRTPLLPAGPDGSPSLKCEHPYADGWRPARTANKVVALVRSPLRHRLSCPGLPDCGRTAEGRQPPR